MNDLQGRRIALLEGRMHGALAQLVRRHGGEPYSVPAMREVAQARTEEVAQLLTRLDGGAVQIVICLTGVGVIALVREAERLNRLPVLLDRLKTVTTVCRGPKPVAALKRQGIAASVRTREPHTTAELLVALEDMELAGQGVALVHYGERDVALATALRERGAELDELCLYAWQLWQVMPFSSLAPVVTRRAVGGRYTAWAQPRENRTAGSLPSPGHWHTRSK